MDFAESYKLNYLIKYNVAMRIVESVKLMLI